MAGSPGIKLDLPAARSAIAAIRALDLRSASIEEIKELLTPVFRGYVVRAPRFEPGLDLFRSRLCNKPVNIRELSYPPAHAVRLGRVNRPQNPVLYCCTSREAPFFESKPSFGATVGIVHWVTTGPLLVNHVGYTARSFKTLGSNRPHTGWAAQPTEIPGGHDNGEVAEFLAQAFTQIVPAGNEHLYKVTVAIAEKLFAHDLFDGLLYPTVAMKANADNFALKPRYADKNLRFVKAEFAKIEAVRDFSYDITVLDTAAEVDGDGRILWRGRLDQWVLRNQGDELTFTAEDGQWVARDKNGNLVEPE